MTTIAYRDGILAADTRASRGEVLLPGHAKKIHRLKDGSVLAVKGDASVFEPFILWTENGGGMENLSGRPNLGGIQNASSIAHMTKTGIVIWELEGWYTEAADFFAMGSGYEAAMGAMHHGATAPEAIKAAMFTDPWTGGRVEWMSLTEGTDKPFEPADWKGIGNDIDIEALALRVARIEESLVPGGPHHIPV